MNCTHIHELLSAYFDDELPDELRLRVLSHLETCPSCAEELTRFKRLSMMANSLPAPVPPEDGWQQLDKLLDDPPVANPPVLQKRWSRPTGRFLAIAAAMILVVGIGWSGYLTWSLQHQHAAVFGHYLAEFEQDPMKAQNILLAKYPSDSVDVESAAEKLGYRPAVADGLPEGYSIESTFVMEMPCCTCVQTLWRRGDGSVLVVFEHDNDQSNWFQGRSCTTTNCGGKECSVVNLNNQLAASWQRGKRHVTIVGAKDVEEVSEIVSWLDGTASVRTS